MGVRWPELSEKLKKMAKYQVLGWFMDEPIYTLHSYYTISNCVHKILTPPPVLAEYVSNFKKYVKSTIVQ